MVMEDKPNLGIENSVKMYLSPLQDLIGKNWMQNQKEDVMIKQVRR